jgi:hypothetical protein
VHLRRLFGILFTSLSGVHLLLIQIYFHIEGATERSQLNESAKSVRERSMYQISSSLDSDFVKDQRFGMPVKNSTGQFDNCHI